MATAELNPIWKQNCRDKINAIDLCPDLQEFMNYIINYLNEQTQSVQDNLDKNQTMVDLIDAIKEPPIAIDDVVEYLGKVAEYYTELAAFYAQPVIDYGLLAIDIASFTTEMIVLLTAKISTLSCSFPPPPA